MERKGRKHEPHESRCPYPTILLTLLSCLFWYLFSLFSHSLDCSTLQPTAWISFLIYLTPAVARAFLLKSLVQIVWSLKQTSNTERQRRSGRSTSQNAASELSSAVLSGQFGVHCWSLLNLTFLILKTGIMRPVFLQKIVKRIRLEYANWNVLYTNVS